MVAAAVPCSWCQSGVFNASFQLGLKIKFRQSLASNLQNRGIARTKTIKLSITSR